MNNQSGPFLGIAVLCENVLQEKDGVLSAIRIVDRVTQSAQGPEPPDEMPALPLQLKMLLTFRAGEARGRFSVKLQPETPSGQQLDVAELPLQLNPGAGANLIIDFGFVAEDEGLYWIDVSLQDERLTRIPLTVVYEPVKTGPA